MKEEIENIFGSDRLPSSSQEEQPQSHVVSQVEPVVHLPARLLVHEAAELQHFEVSRSSHHHGQGQQQHAQARLQVVVTCLGAEEGTRGYASVLKTHAAARSNTLLSTPEFEKPRSAERGRAEKLNNNDSQPCHVL